MYFSEISASLYPWDLADEGVEVILDNLEELTGCNSVYLIAVMHHEKRPLTDFYYPHNPVRKTYYPEDSRAYFRPHESFYGRIKPLTSARDFLGKADWMQTLISAARKRGMKTGVELSHTIVDAERLKGELSDCIQRNIYREPTGWPVVCLNNPEVKAYMSGLCADLITNYDLDYVQTCLIPFIAGRRHTHPAVRLLGVALGGCFCSSCEQAANQDGYDFAAIRKALQRMADGFTCPSLQQSHELELLEASNITETEILMDHPELQQWLIFRRNSVTRFFKEVYDRAHDVKPTIDMRLNAYISANQELSGLSLRQLKNCFDSVRSSDYSEQTGNPEQMNNKRKWLRAVRYAIGDEMHFVSAIGVRPKATPELIRQGVAISAECGADGLTIGHYDGASFSNLRAIREGMDLADIEVVE
jgi:hypothetical protein